MSAESGKTHYPEATVLETFQSLLVAFVLAMTFRGFVTEGFVIPTGSMAPTLLGKHVLLHSEQTGLDYAVGVDASPGLASLENVADPILGPRYGSGTGRRAAAKRMGDRILVLKSLYPFAEPHRYDVVVFKNPTDPTGASANYIKRLIGLPDERIWLADGDVFAAPNVPGTTPDDYRVQRKPEHVQRAVWQLVHDSQLIPVQPDRLERAYHGPPWTGSSWDTSGRVYRCDTAEPSTLEWNQHVRPIDDWVFYDAIGPRARVLFPMADLRVRAAIIADDPAALESTFQIEVCEHIFQFRMNGSSAQVRMRPQDSPDDWTASEPATVDTPAPGEAMNIEFWHVDQMMVLFVDGRRVAELEYDWSAQRRMELAVGGTGWRDIRDLSQEHPNISWSFRGSPVSLHRVRTGRDLFYRPARIPSRRDPDLPSDANPTVTGHDFDDLVAPSTYGFGTHPDKPAALGPDHYFMLGDNSQASLDSRLWGNPHPLVAEQVDPSPFVVHRSLIIGKAWVVYFPAPYSLTETGIPFVPDFGRLRFIR